jgi:hypothetical protein
MKVETSSMSFVVPSTWNIVGIVTNDDGIAGLESQFLRIDGPGDTIVSVNTRSGELWLLDNPPVLLRAEGRNGAKIEITELFAKVDDVAPHLYHIVESLDITGPLASPTPARTPTRTPTPRPSVTP